MPSIAIAFQRAASTISSFGTRHEAAGEVIGPEEPRFAWRSRLGFDGALLGAVVRKLSDAVLAFFSRPARRS